VQNKEKLQQIVDDPTTSDAERAEAQRELDANHTGPETAVDSRLENELLFEYHAASLVDVQHFDLHAFCAARKFSADADKLYFKWLKVSPVARQKMQQMRKHLENYFLESYDRMLARYRAALDRGSDVGQVNREALKFYRDWVDSSITPEELRSPFRELITVLASRCEAPRDN
jgi:hypothetical protein